MSFRATVFRHSITKKYYTMPESKRRKWFRRITWLLLFGFATGFLLLHFVAPRLIISRKPKPPKQADFGPYHAESLKIQGYDEVPLSAYLIEPMVEDSIRGVLIFIHGIGSSKEAFFDSARDYAGLNIVSFIYDQRAYGESGGDYITYGFYEKFDLEAIVTFLKARYPNLPVEVWGTSLGGAVGLQALAHDPRLDFGIISSTFTDLETVVFEYQRRYSKGIGLRALTDYALWRAGKIAGFDPTEARPFVAARQITQPILLIHGDTDKRIGIQHGRTIFKNLASREKQFVSVAGAGHLNTFEVGGEELSERVLEFLDAVLQ